MRQPGRDLRHHPPRRPPGGGRVGDRRGQAAHRRATRLPRRRTTSRAAGRAPTRRTSSSSPAPRPSCKLATSTLVAFGSTRRPRGKVDDDPTLRNLLEASTTRGVHRRQELGVPRDRGAADHARRGRGDDRRLGRVPARPRAPGARRHGALLRRLQGTTRSSRCGRSRRPSSRARPTSCCATPTAARCRTRSGDIVAAVHAHVGDDVIDRHPLPRRHRLRRRQLDGRGARPAPATCRARSTASASAPATPTSPRSSPTSSSSSGYRCLPDGRMERLTAVSHHVAEMLNRAVNPQAPYVGSSAFAHKAGLHVSAIVARQGRLRAHRSRSWSATARASSCPRWPAGRRSR